MRAIKECITGYLDTHSGPADIAKFYQKASDYFQELKKEHKERFTGSFPVFQAGEKNNVISETCFIAGTLRSVKEGLS